MRGSGKGRGRPVYASDFEATTDPLDCRVWGWGIANTQDPDNVMQGTTLSSWVSYANKRHAIIYFHNLKYDGHFIIDYLLKNGYTLIKDNSELRTKTFKTLISDMNKFFSITVCWETGKRTEIRDSLKKLPMNLANVAKSFDVPVMKGEIDYHKPRPIGYKPTEEEREYIHNDVFILASAIREVHEEGMKKLTLPSDALTGYKDIVGSKMFSKAFPILPATIDGDIRRAYRGGFTYADPRFSGRLLEYSGLVLDVNSLYPSVMKTALIPFGEPMFKRGKVEPTKTHPLAIFTVTFTARLKMDHIPTIQVKNSFRFSATEYLRNINDPTTLTVTNVDWDLINDHYHVDVIEYGGGYLFQATAGLFDSYIDKYSEMKANSEGGRRAIAKLFLNALYGKFATNPNVTSKFPVLNEEGIVKYVRGVDETRPPIYTAAGVFITAYARDITIRSAQENFECFAYADTDSLHLLTNKVPNNIEVHPSKLGAWKLEYEFKRAFYVRPKVYLEERHDGTFTNAFAGLPEKISEGLTFDDLKDGATFTKMQPKAVPGGIVLQEIDFTLNMH